ncbi:MAG: hypothetical protein HY904_09570 [Deltaproteobacteria bacterium]|nr:hypothetical protein [Deltaproteobacteria bacterium]
MRTFDPRLVRMAQVVWGLALAVPAYAQGVPAPGPRTALWPLKADGVSDDTAYQVGGTLRKEMDALLPGRTATQDEVEAARARPDAQPVLGCLEEVRCTVALAKAAGVPQLLAGVVRNQGDQRAVELWLVDAVAGRELGRATAVLPAKPGPETASALRELCARLLAPELHVGTLVLNGLDTTTDVLVDGDKRVDKSTAQPSVRLPLRVGKHAVDIQRFGKPVMTEMVDIRFEESVVLMTPPPGVVAEVGPAARGGTAFTAVTAGGRRADAAETVPASRGIRLPGWVGPVVAAAAVVPALLGALFLVDLLFLGPLVLADPAQCQPYFVEGSGGGQQFNKDANPLNTCGSLWRATSRKEVGIRPVVALDAGGALFSAGLVLALVVAGALLLAGSLVQPMLEGPGLEKGHEVRVQDDRQGP